MKIEFLTSIDDYNFSHIPKKVINVLKVHLNNTAFCEKIYVNNYTPTCGTDFLGTQRNWQLG